MKNDEYLNAIFITVLIVIQASLVALYYTGVISWSLWLVYLPVILVVTAPIWTLLLLFALLLLSFPLALHKIDIQKELEDIEAIITRLNEATKPRLEQLNDDINKKLDKREEVEK